jgi:hypothetical protein
VSRKNPVNIAASVRQKILNKARIEHLGFSGLVQYYAMERFLYRLSVSEHSNKFILKGALLLRAWGFDEFRPTMDIDFLGLSSSNSDQLMKQISDVCSVSVKDDGLIFDIDSIKSEHITEGADYVGNRITFLGKLDTVKIKMQIDVGFGDSVFPDPIQCTLPVIFDFSPAKLMCYRPETTVAEKFEAMVKLGNLNSRIKDFFDIMLLDKYADLDHEKLTESIIRTFSKRGTIIPDKFIDYSEDFIVTSQKAWSGFIKKNRIENITGDFEEVIYKVKSLINPVITEWRKSL